MVPDRTPGEFSVPRAINLLQNSQDFFTDVPISHGKVTGGSLFGFKGKVVCRNSTQSSVLAIRENLIPTGRGGAADGARIWQVKTDL